ncbi:MAG: hypothetical protein AAF355_14475 [Myxococcota bacterium]
MNFSGAQECEPKDREHPDDDLVIGDALEDRVGPDHLRERHDHLQ